MSELVTDREAVVFLCKRLLDEAGSRGMSSDAMIALAVAYGDVPDEYDGPVPHDTDDLSRCCEAFKLAPWKIRHRMLPILAKWSADVLNKQREREEPDAR